MITLNQLLDLLEQMATAHLQINTFGSGVYVDAIEATEQTDKFPLMYAVIEPGNINGRIQTIRLSLLFADQLNPDRSNEAEIASDMLSVGNDIVAQLRSPAYYDDFVLDESIPQSPFSERFGDFLAGWKFDVTFEGHFAADRCAVPSTLVDVSISPQCADVNIINTDGTPILSDLPAGSTGTLPNITLTEGDLTQSIKAAGVDIVAKELFFKRTLTIKAGSYLEPGYVSNDTGKLKNISLTNISSCTVERNRNGVITNLDTSVTNDVAAHDIITIKNAVVIDSNLDASVTLTCYHDAITEETLSFPDMAGEGRYLYGNNFNGSPQTIFRIDLSDNSVTNLAVPSGKSFMPLVPTPYGMYTFGANHYARLDIDPSSPTFGDVLNDGAWSFVANNAAYDFLRDRIYVGNSTFLGAYKRSDLSLAKLISNGSTISISLRAGMYYSHHTEQMYLCDQQQVSKLNTRTFNLDGMVNSNSNSGMIRYNPKNGLFYLSGGGVLYVLKPDTSLFQTIVNANANRSAIAFAPNQNLAFCANIFGNSIAVINTATNTNVGSVPKLNLGSNELGTRDLIYSPYTGKIYAQAANNVGALTGVNRIHILNPALPLANMYEGYIDVGNMMSANATQYLQHQICIDYFNVI